MTDGTTKTMVSPIRVLHLEDNQRDADLIRDLIAAEEPGWEVRQVDTAAGFERELSGTGVDIVLCDFNLPDYDGHSALRLARSRRPDTPVVMVSGSLSPEDGVTCIHEGAVDYLLKNRLERLVPALRRALAEAERTREQHRAELKARASEERYRQLFDFNPVPMWVYDLHSLRFLAVNEAALRQYGFTREEFLEMTVLQIRPPEECSSVLGAIRATPTVGHRKGEARHCRKDGTVLQVEFESQPFTYEGSPARLVLATDVTEKKLLQEKVLHAQRLESLGMLAAGIVHDFNNVLSPVLFAGPLLRQRLSSPADLNIIKNLEVSAERGAGLVRQILGFARATSGEMRLLQVGHLAQEIRNLIEETFPRSIRVELVVERDAWTVIGNATQIHQVMLNLCVNARDAMPTGGILRLKVANRRLSAVEAEKIPEARPGSWLVVEVSDSGTGIPPEILGRIWDPFFTTKEPGKGTGLGLSTVRGIVASHHGLLAIESVVGAGTTVTMYLPAVEDRSIRSSQFLTKEIPRGSGELVLLVDDDQGVREVVAAMLQQHGYRVIRCSDGLEAIELFTANPVEIGLVITDVDMRYMGGAALARALLRIRPEVRLILMSGLSRSEPASDEVESARSVAHAFLRKPFAPEDLLETVYQVIHHLNGLPPAREAADPER